MDQTLPDFSLRESFQAGIATLSPHGELDVYTAPKLREAAVKAIDGGNTRLVLDLREMTFIDSTGLGAIAGLLKRVRERDGDLVISRPRPGVMKVIELTGLDRVLTIEH